MKRKKNNVILTEMADFCRQTLRISVNSELLTPRQKIGYNSDNGIAN